MKAIRHQQLANEGEPLRLPDEPGERIYADGENPSVSGHIAFDESPVATVLCSLAGHVVQTNRAFRQMFELAAMPEPGTDILSVCRGKVALDFLDVLARDGVVHQQKLVIDFPDKEALKVLCTATRIDGAGNIPCWLIITFDRRINSSAIPPQKLNAELLSAELEALAEAGYWQLQLRDDSDVMECSMEWSSGMCALLDSKSGASRTLRHWLNKVVPADRAMVAQAVRKIALLGSSYDIEYRVLGRDGNHALLRGRAKRIEAPFVIGGAVLLGVEQRIDTHANNPDQDADIVYILQTVVESSEAPIYAIDRDLQLVCSNNAFRTALGQDMSTAAICLGDLTARLPDVAQRQRVVKNLRRALSGQTRIEVAELGGDTGGCWYDFTYNPVRTADGEIIGVAVLGVDVSARYADINSKRIR